MKRVLVAAVAGACLLALGACTTKEVNQPTATTAGQAANSTVPTTAGGSTTTTGSSSDSKAHVGATLSLSGGGDQYSVTLTQVINPATGSSGPPTDDNGNPNGNSYVATLMTIKNTGSQSISDDANSNSTLIGSNNQSYNADFDNVNECTNFNDGSYQLGPGESATGCVVFSLPAGVTPAKFQFSTTGGIGGGDFGEWLIP